MIRLKTLRLAIVFLVVMMCVGTPALGASESLPQVPASLAAHPSRPAPPLSSTDSAVTFEVVAPWEQLGVDPADAQGYVQVSLPGWSATSRPGAPMLPMVAQSIAAPLGAQLSVQVETGPAHTLTLPAPALPVATQFAEWDPQAAMETLPSLGAPRLIVQEDPAVYAASEAYPGALAQVASDALLRQQRVVGIAAYPVQYRPATRELTVYEWLRITVTFESASRDDSEQSPDSVQPPLDSPAYENVLRRSLLNYEKGRHWRQALTPNPSPMTGEGSVDALNASAAATPWAPPDPGWRVKVREEGFYQLTYAELSAAGVPVSPSLPTSSFQLFNLGSEVAIYVSDQDADGQFESSDYLLFYGQPLASKYTLDNVYWLTFGKASGLRMATRDGAPASADTPAYYGAQRHMESNGQYASLAPGDDALDRWMWDYIYPPSKPSWSHTFSLAAPYAAPATLRVALLGYLQSAANPDHRAQVYLNNIPVGSVVDWDGITWKIAEIPLPQGALLTGNNTLKVVCSNITGGSYDLVYVDWAELEFANTFLAEGNTLAFRYDTAGTWKYQVDGFSNNQVVVFDVSNPAAVVRITGVGIVGSGPYAAVFQSSPARYWTTATSAYRTVQAVEQDSASDLRSTSNGADHITITHKAFAAQAAQLRDYRAAQGRRALAVDVQDVYDEFGYGIVGAAPIRDFLAYAYANWQAPAPSFVVLLGDGHYDPKNYLGYGRVSFIPPYLAPVDPWIGETAADNRFVTLVGSDTFPDMMLGRLAVNSSAEATTFINKIMAYEQSPAPGIWRQQVLAVADNADSGGSFASLSNNLLSCCLPAPYEAQKVYYGVTHLTVAAARQAIQEGFNAGKLVVNYIGHAGINNWAAESLFTASDVSLLANGAKLPVILSMTCTDGQYHYPYPYSLPYEALAEVITREEGKGAVASWSPTGKGVASGHDYLDRGFFQAVFVNGERGLGEATMAGKLNLWATGTSRDLIDTYLLFGDPAMQIALPVAPSPTNTPTATATRTLTPTNTPKATRTTRATATPTSAPTATMASLTSLPLHMGAMTITSALRKGTYSLTATGTVLDASQKAVASALVYGRWTRPDGTTDQQTVSSSKGAVSFKVSSTQKGVYRFCVTNIAKTGWVYDPASDVETCDTLTIQ